MTHTSASPVVAILLAAGASRRFGANKLLAELPNGESLGLHSAAQLCDGPDELLVIVNSADSDSAAMFRQAGYATLVAPDAADGMGHSLAHGIKQRPEALAWLVCLADMPLVQRTTVSAICDHLRQGANIVVPRYRGSEGHPVGFSRKHRDALINLQGDRGARSLRQQESSHTLYLDVEDAGVLRDFDTPDALSKLQL